MKIFFNRKARKEGAKSSKIEVASTAKDKKGTQKTRRLSLAST